MAVESWKSGKRATWIRRWKIENKALGKRDGCGRMCEGETEMGQREKHREKWRRQKESENEEGETVQWVL